MREKGKKKKKKKKKKEEKKISGVWFYLQTLRCQQQTINCNNNKQVYTYY